MKNYGFLIHRFIIYLILIILLFFSISYSQITDSLAKKYYQKGKTAFADSNYESAAEWFKKSIYEEKNAASYYELAKIYIKRKSVFGRFWARKYVERAIRKDPENVKIRLLHAELLSKISSYAELNEYKKIISIDSTNAKIWYLMGVIEEKEFNDYHNSVNMTEGTPLNLDFQNIQAQPMQGYDRKKQIDNANLLSFSRDINFLVLEEFAIEDFFEAESYFKRALKYDSTHSQARLHLCYLYEDAGYPDRAVPYLTKLVDMEPKNKDAFLFLGLIYYKTLNISAAHDAYKSAIELMSEEEKIDFTFASVRFILESIFEDKLEEMDYPELSKFIEKFWKVNDPLYLTEYNERILEHYSRVAYANLRFSVPSLNVVGWRSDRGQVVIRYGEPLSRVRMRPDYKQSKTEVWHYDDMVFAFADAFKNDNFKFSDPFSESQYPGDFILYAESMERVKPQGYRPIFEGPTFNSFMDIVQFKNLDAENPNLTDIYIIHAFDFVDSLLQHKIYDLSYNWGIFLFDKDYNTMNSKKGEVTHLPAGSILNIAINKNILVNTCNILIIPDSVYLAFDIQRNADKGVSSNRRNMVIENFRKDSLQVSDLVLSTKLSKREFPGTCLTRNDINMLPNPTHIFNPNHQLFLYYELYNLELDELRQANFEHNITITKVGEVEEAGFFAGLYDSAINLLGLEEKKSISLTSEYQDNNSFSQVYVQLDLSELEEGDYKLSLGITDLNSGHITANETMIYWR